MSSGQQWGQRVWIDQKMELGKDVCRTGQTCAQERLDLMTPETFFRLRFLLGSWEELYRCKKTWQGFCSELQSQRAHLLLSGAVPSMLSRAENGAGAGKVRGSRGKQCPWVQFYPLCNFSASNITNIVIAITKHWLSFLACVWYWYVWCSKCGLHLLNMCSCCSYLHHCGFFSHCIMSYW